MKMLQRMQHGATEYVMKGRLQAIITGIIFTMTPFLGWVSYVIIGLLTLRKGVKEGLIALLWMSLPIVVAAGVGVISPGMAVSNLVGGSVLTFLFACALRQTQSWKFTLEVGLVLGLLLVGILHAWIPDMVAFWSARLTQYLSRLKSQFGVSLNDKQLNLFSHFASGIQYGFFWISALLNLVIARALQSSLYHPGQFTTEFESIRLSSWSAFLFLVVAVASAQKIAIAQDILPIIGLFFVLAGLSFFHAWARVRWHFSTITFFVFYLLLMIFFLHIASVLALLALTDTFFNLRQYIIKK